MVPAGNKAKRLSFVNHTTNNSSSYTSIQNTIYFVILITTNPVTTKNKY